MARLAPVEELFVGRHFDAEIVVLCVRWYLSFKLSYLDLVGMMGERGIAMAHTTIMRWVQHLAGRPGVIVSVPNQAERSLKAAAAISNLHQSQRTTGKMSLFPSQSR